MKWGLVTLARHQELQRHGTHLHIWHDGVDVTNRCFVADDTGDGWAELYALNTDGRFYVNRRDEAAKIRVTGIAIVEGEPFHEYQSASIVASQ